MSIEIKIYGKNMMVTDRINEYVTKRASRLERYLSGIEEARVDLAYVKTARNAADRRVAQITVHGKKFMLRSEERSDDIFAAFDVALAKIQRQISRYKGKHYRGRGDGKSLGQIASQEIYLEEQEQEEENTHSIVRHKKFITLPMDEQEAIEQMRLLGHEDFFVFYNATTNTINVLYQRRDGNYGLIEPELG